MCNCTGKPCGNHGAGMFLLRVVAGIIFIYAGWWKLQHPEMSAAGFAVNHLPAWVAMAIAWLEIIGGAALVLGVFTCLFASLFAIEMAVATILTWKGMGFQMAEMPLLMMAAMLALKHAGRGKWGLGKHCGCPMCAAMGGFGKKGANVCMNCGHASGAGEGCGCSCHQ